MIPRMRLLLALLWAAAFCSAASAGTIQVAAAENVWGSIASQLGGDRVHVGSVITNPATDPHSYEPTAADARALAGAQLVVVNGAGYDPWADRLLAANPVSGRIVLKVGDLVGVRPGGNPHLWYSPAFVQKVIGELTRDYSKLDQKDAGYFARQQAAFERRLAGYRGVIAAIRKRYLGVPLGASESVFAPLAQALGLKLLTPPSFLKAISEGAEPTAADKSAVDAQIAHRQIKVWVYDGQNATPDVKRLTDAARKRGIPVTTITETLFPANATFQQWQTRQLQALASALHAATGR
jgi:zinc/manganese transport system substrate-binding protein